MDLLLFGPPGAGKGTQAKFLVDTLRLPQISTGDMMRAERASGSDLGKRFDEYMSAGKLVPDELVLELIGARLSQPDAKNGAIFDGYPRTVPQAEALDRMLESKGRNIARVISLEVDKADVVDRVAGRRVCQNCGQTYHVRYTPPPPNGHCSACGQAQIIQRKDDNEDVVSKRFEEYQEKTAPVLDYYRDKGLVVSVNGLGSLDEVKQRIAQAVPKQK